MMMVNDASSTVRSTPCSARTSFGVPGLNVVTAWRISSTRQPPLPSLHAFQHLGQNERGENECGGDQLQIVRIQPPTQSHRYQQAEEDGAHHGARDRESK